MRLWHASFVPLPVGTILVPSPGYEERWHPQSAGRILEDLRPEGMLAHRDAVFMCEDEQDCDDCGAHCEWLFLVEPSGEVRKHDLSWASDIDRLVSDGWPATDPAVVELARRYWQGEPSDLPVWEHLAGSATIVSVEPW